MDDTFDKMHIQKRLRFTTEPTLFSFLVFVVWKTDFHDRKKCCTIVDIQKLNKLVLFDS